MNDDDGWDWRWLYYSGTVLLRMTESQFWKCTPKKLCALVNVYVEQHSTSDDANSTSYGYIDQIL